VADLSQFFSLLISLFFSLFLFFKLSIRDGDGYGSSLH
jgi:hypothetical protein